MCVYIYIQIYIYIYIIHIKYIIYIIYIYIYILYRPTFIVFSLNCKFLLMYKFRRTGVYNKYNKLLMVLNSLIDFCFDGRESKYITVNNYGACWIKNIKDNVICLNKQQIKDAVSFYFLIVISLLALRSSVRFLVFLWGLIQVLFLPTYSYTSVKVKGWTNLRRMT